jgi:hypothetical protein
MARALADVLGDRARTAELGQSAREWAERNWNARHAAARLREHLEVVYFRRLRREPLPSASALPEDVALGASS